MNPPENLVDATERFLDAGGSPHYLIGILRGAIRVQWTEQQTTDLVAEIRP